MYIVKPSYGLTYFYDWLNRHIFGLKLRIHSLKGNFFFIEMRLKLFIG